MEPVSANYDFAVDDAVRYNIYCSSVSSHLRRSRLRYRLLAPAIWMGMAIVVDALTETPTSNFTLVMAAISIGWLFIAPMLWQSQLKKKVRKLYLRPENRGVLGRHTITAHHEGLTDEAGEMRVDVAWEDVREIQILSDYLYIFIGNQSALVIPRERFYGPARFDDFAEQIRTLHSAHHPSWEH